MRVVFMGTPEFSVPALRAIAARHEVVCVYSQPPRAAGRGQKPRTSPVQAAAEALGLPVRTPLRLKGAEEQAEFAALGAALCWALTGVMSTGPVAAIGPFAFNLFRQSFVTVVLAAIVLAAGTWREVDPALVPRMMLSGVVGILLGDTVLFFALRRLGPRRTGAR